MNKKNMTIATEEPQKAEELVKRTEVENTPFLIIETQGKCFGTFGQYKITEDYKTPAEVKKQLTEMTWNRVIQIMTLVHELLTKKSK